LTDKRSHSSAIEDELAEKVRAHFRAVAAQEEKSAGAAPAPPPPAHGPVRTAAAEPIRAVTTHPEPAQMTRTIDQIKAAARRALTQPKPAPVAEKPVVPLATSPVPPAAAGPRKIAGSPVPPSAPIGSRPATPTHPAVSRPSPIVVAPAAGPTPGGLTAKVSEAASLRVSADPELSPARPAGPTAPVSAKSSRGALRKSPASNQPIYPGVAATKPLPARPPIFRRTGEHRPMHPTALRPSSAAVTPVSRPHPARPAALSLQSAGRIRRAQPRRAARW